MSNSSKLKVLSSCLFRISLYFLQLRKDIPHVGTFISLFCPISAWCLGTKLWSSCCFIAWGLIKRSAYLEGKSSTPTSLLCVKDISIFSAAVTFFWCWLSKFNHDGCGKMCLISIFQNSRVLVWIFFFTKYKETF